MARKVLTHKRNVGGLEAPRNSLELPVETSQSYSAAGDNALLSYQVNQDWSEQSCYPTEASMKRLINEEVSKRPNTRHNTPNIVARLMGMDTLPLDKKTVVQTIEKENKHTGINFSRKEQTEKGSSGLVPFHSNTSSDEFNLFHRDKDSDLDQWSSSVSLGKPKRREHPQEEELQKFKKEFEAWQAARFRECSRIVEHGSIPSQLLVQEKPNKEEKVLHAKSRKTAGEKPVELKDLTVTASYKSGKTARSHGKGGLQHHGNKLELFPTEKKISFPVRRETINRDLEQSSLTSFDQKPNKSSAPTKIVILKPGFERIGNNEESWASSSSTFEERGSMEDFLEEVKERLKCELQGNTLKKGTMVRGGGIETPFSEKPSDPKKIAQHIAKQVRESVTRDLGMNLLRSESTRSYKSEIQFNGPGSPEFINRDTRRFLSERLRNVLKRETHMDISSTVGSSSTSSLLDNELGRLEQTRDILKAGNKVGYWENVRDEAEMQTRSFRHGPDNDVDATLHRELSPRNLIRSLSAPVTGTSFGKLLLEDRRVLTGVHIRRIHEAIEKVTVDVKKQKKERFNLKEKVSNFRYSLTFRKNLFGRKVQSVVESRNTERDFIKDIMSGPTVIMNPHDRHENSTEVPPSPASVCSSAHEEFWRAADYLSPISTPDIRSMEDNSVPHVFREISSNLNELRRQLNQLESDRPEDTSQTRIKEELLATEMGDLEDPAESYIRDLLVASGLYDGSSDKSFLRWDSFGKPLSNSVFEQVEESFKENEKESGLDHKALHDLLNEVVSSVLGPPVGMSRLRRRMIGSATLPLPRGRELLDRLWKIIRVYVYPPTDKPYYLLDSIVAPELQPTPWSGLLDDEVNDLGREMECLVIGDVIEEIVKDMML